MEEIIAEVEGWVQRVNQKQAEKKEELFQMSQRFNKEMTIIFLCPRQILVKVLSEAFGLSAGCRVPETEREILRRRINEAVDAVFGYLFDRQKNDGMFYEIDLD